MALNVAGLAKTVVFSKEILADTATSAETIKYIRSMPGVKTDVKIPIISQAVTLQDGKACKEFAGTDDTTFTNQTITAFPILVHEEWCPLDWQGLMGEEQLKITASSTSMPYEKLIVDKVLEAIAVANEMTIWQGDTTKGLYRRFDGFIKKLTGVAKAVTLQDLADKKFTATELITATIKAIPVKDRKKAVIFVGHNMIDDYIMELQAENKFYNTTGAGGDTCAVVGSNIKLIAVGGLDDTKYAVAINPQNLVYGFDLDSAIADFKLWYSNDADKVRMKVLFNAGVAVLFGANAVLGQIKAM